MDDAQLRRLIAGLFIVILSLSNPVFSTAAQSGERTVAGVPHDAKWVPWAEFGGYASNERTRGELALWAPLMQGEDALAFVDVRGKLFEQDAEEGNIALGFRQMLPSGWNVGVWIGWDVRQTELDNTFNQVSGGFELLSQDIDVRVNGYAPINDEEPIASTSTFSAVVTGPSIVVQRTTTASRELALRGIDAEIGFRVPFERWFDRAYDAADLGLNRHELRLYAGGFYFDNPDLPGEMAGPRARAEWRINDVIPGFAGSRLTLEAEYQQDSIRDDQVEVGARLRIPFGFDAGSAERFASLSAQEHRMMDGLERDTDIILDAVTTTTTTDENAIDAATDVLLTKAVTVDGGDDLQDAIDSNGQNTLIIAKGGGDAGGDGEKRRGDAFYGHFVLQPRQTIVGGGTTIQLKGQESQIVFDFTAPGSRPTLKPNDNAPVVTVNNYTHVAGLNIQGYYSHGLGPQEAGEGISFTDGIGGGNGLMTVVLEQNTIRNVNGAGIFFGSNNSDVRILNNEISTVYSSGIEFEDENSNVLISGNTTTDTHYAGIEFYYENSNIRVLDNTISNVMFGVLLDEHNTDVVISGNTISGMTMGYGYYGGPGFGIGLLYGNENVTITNNTVSEFLAGVVLGEHNKDVEIAGNTISGTTMGDGYFREPGSGIRLMYGNENVTIANNTLIETGLFGVILETDNENVAITGNEFRNIGMSVMGGYMVRSRSVIDQAAIAIGADNIVSVSDNTFTGIFAGDGLLIGEDNTISGRGNINNATIGGLLCRVTDTGNTGSTSFTDGSVCPNGVIMPGLMMGPV
ncbi:MAG: right-handed parallel beta-helix repeat-containing protein [Hyphomicrobiaceae bacterium]